MLEHNTKIITAHLNGKEEEKLHALKALLNKSEDELFNGSEFNFSNAGLKYKIFDRRKVDISRSDLIENSFTVFSKHYNDITHDEFNKLKIELIQLPIELHPVIHFFEESYIDISIYNILHFIKDTRYVINHIEDKKRYFYSTYKTKVLEAQINLMEKLKTETFLYPSSKFDKEVFETKDKVLSFVNEHYNMLFAWYSLTADQNFNGVSKDEVTNTVLNDFRSNLNAIRTTKKDAIKSLAMLLFKMYDTRLNSNDNELVVENILRACFKKEIEEINKNKGLTPEYLDTFKVTSKEFKKDSYIYSVFDDIKIYGINDKNKYFYFDKMTAKEIMKMYFSLIQEASKAFGREPLPITKTYYKFLRQQLQNPHKSAYLKQYPEFFTKENPTILDIMATFFLEMKKTAPDNIK